MSLLERIITEKPRFHDAETETERFMMPEESFLS
jgi:hypothetical protein